MAAFRCRLDGFPSAPVVPRFPDSPLVEIEMTRTAVLLLAALSASVARAEAPKAPAPAAAAAQATATIPVKGMSCGGCVATVTEALQKVPGVKSVAVSLEKEQVVVVYERTRTDAKKLAEAIDAAGYQAGMPATN
jgi:copper chaperone